MTPCQSYCKNMYQNVDAVLASAAFLVSKRRYIMYGCKALMQESKAGRKALPCRPWLDVGRMLLRAAKPLITMNYR